jgi:hypothetical protein
MIDGKFHFLLKFLHFADNDQIDPNSTEKKLYKIKLVIYYLKQKCATLYIPEQFVCVCVWMNPYSSGIVDFDGNSTVNYCESRTCYVHNLIVHTGEGNELVNSMLLTQWAQIVFELMSHLLRRGTDYI